MPDVMGSGHVLNCNRICNTNHMLCYKMPPCQYTQEQQSAKGADPQPEYYIDKIIHLTEVR